MDKKWRPPDWEGDKFHCCMDLTKGGGTYSDIYEVYEAGADAMLEALKRNSGNLRVKAHSNGWVILIPDEEDIDG